MQRAVLLFALVLVGGCSKVAPHGDGAASPSAVASASPSASASAALPSLSAVAPAASTGSTASASATASAGGPEADGGASKGTPETEAGAKAVVADNKVSPTEEAELQERAKGLFEAIVKDDPRLGEAFWFPKEPFVPLKDVKDPGRYWETLHKTYASDIHALHKKRKSWSGATFERFSRGSAPKWVKPGEEANKIGYYRSFHGSLRFDVGGKSTSLDVLTAITWQGRWYVTHLRKFKK